jgi:hypothetical protein
LERREASLQAHDAAADSRRYQELTEPRIQKCQSPPVKAGHEHPAVPGKFRSRKFEHPLHCVRFASPFSCPFSCRGDARARDRPGAALAQPRRAAVLSNETAWKARFARLWNVSAKADATHRALAQQQALVALKAYRQVAMPGHPARPRSAVLPA